MYVQIDVYLYTYYVYVHNVYTCIMNIQYILYTYTMSCIHTMLCTCICISTMSATYYILFTVILLQMLGVHNIIYLDPLSDFCCKRNVNRKQESRRLQLQHIRLDIQNVRMRKTFTYTAVRASSINSPHSTLLMCGIWPQHVRHEPQHRNEGQSH